MKENSYSISRKANKRLRSSPDNLARSSTTAKPFTGMMTLDLRLCWNYSRLFYLSCITNLRPCSLKNNLHFVICGTAKVSLYDGYDLRGNLLPSDYIHHCRPLYLSRSVVNV